MRANLNSNTSSSLSSWPISNSRKIRAQGVGEARWRVSHPFSQYSGFPALLFLKGEVRIRTIPSFLKQIVLSLAAVNIIPILPNLEGWWWWYFFPAKVQRYLTHALFLLLLSTSRFVLLSTYHLRGAHAPLSIALSLSTWAPQLLPTLFDLCERGKNCCSNNPRPLSVDSELDFTHTHQSLKRILHAKSTFQNTPKRERDHRRICLLPFWMKSFLPERVRWVSDDHLLSEKDWERHSIWMDATELGTTAKASSNETCFFPVRIAESSSHPTFT